MTIKIASARYGVPNKFADVTAIVQTMVQKSNGELPINNQSMGGDPAAGHVKQLNVVYFFNDGPPQMATGTEGSSITLVDKPHLPGGLPR